LQRETFKDGAITTNGPAKFKMAAYDRLQTNNLHKSTGKQ